MGTFADDARNAARLTPAQVTALDTLSGYEPGETLPDGLVSPRTLASLKRRGLVDDNGLTGAGRDILNAYI